MLHLVIYEEDVVVFLVVDVLFAFIFGISLMDKNNTIVAC